MKLTSEAFPVRFDPCLVEAVVLQVAEVAGSPERDRFRREKDAVYEIETADLRETGFHELDARWFRRFGVADGLLNLLREHVSLANGISGCYVLSASSYKDEGADLHAAKGEPTETALPVLVARLLPKTLADPDRLTPLLRHELLHVTDMLDPQFGYEPALPDMDKGPMFQRLIQDRYRVLWNTTIDGRLARAGQLPAHQAERGRQEFLESFKMLGGEADRYFQQFFTGPRPKHAEMVAFAVQPGSDHRNSRQCPLCSLPASHLHSNAGGLHPCIVDAIQRDFPQWEEENGLCLQCADLYEARAFRIGAWPA
jgi:hypothetical protein